ncbi:transmembrane protein, putative [Bodo saltans]|uniref:Transmembrane protein, putative n=1 Tax=Bodo saltans TaxID=75058 RepID=A0A0S4JFB6_BODSA|nr:transmembrane protein, putative [Bodo saltans]|eukprot:CUG89151.1 transmembrane protein, putative [Bodo saltans]
MADAGIMKPSNHIDYRALGICAAYCFLSSGCVLHNKFLLSSIFPHENSLLLAQNVFSITLLMIFSSRFVKNGAAPIAALHIPVTLHHNAGDWWIGLCYSFNVVTGIWCLGYLSVPMFSSIKRCNILVVWVIEAVFAQTATTWPTFKPLLILLGGTLLMSFYDLQFSAIGYFFGAMSCVFQSVAFELGKRLVNNGKDLWSVLLINSVVSTAVQLTYMLLAGELPILTSTLGYLFGGRGNPAEFSEVPHFLTVLRKGNPADVADTLSPITCF